jgi:hypothetical protein
MKMIKIALLATAALTAVSMSARADDLSDLKAQIAALNAQVAATADVPAAGPTVTWSGNVAAGIIYTTDNIAPIWSETEIKAKWGLSVKATNDTAVGEVGVKVAFAGNAQASHYTGPITGWANNNGASTVAGDGFWGWWKISPEMTLGAGRDGSLSGNGEGFDGRANAIFAGGDANGGYNNGDVAQMRLSYSSGPIALAIALEDGDSNNGSGFGPAPGPGNLVIGPFGGLKESNFGVAGDLKYSGDSFGVELNAGVQNVGGFHLEDVWTVNAGAHVALSDMFTLSAAAGMGSGTSTTDDYTKASLYGKATLSDSVWAEAGVSHKWNTSTATTKFDVTAVGMGIYYAPVSQLTVGLEANYDVDNSPAKASNTKAALVTKFSF